MHCFHYHQSLLKMVKKSRIPERGSIFSVHCKVQFFFESCFPSLFHRTRIKRINPGIIRGGDFPFPFLKLLKEIFISEIRTGLCLGVGLGFQYADISSKGGRLGT